MDYLIHCSWDDSCVHAGGLSCLVFFVWHPLDPPVDIDCDMISLACAVCGKVVFSVVPVCLHPCITPFIRGPSTSYSKKFDWKVFLLYGCFTTLSWRWGTSNEGSYQECDGNNCSQLILPQIYTQHTRPETNIHECIRVSVNGEREKHCRVRTGICHRFYWRYLIKINKSSCGDAQVIKTEESLWADNPNLLIVPKLNKNPDKTKK